MKIIAIIISIITITFSALPCDDEVVIGSQQSASISQSSDFDNHTDTDLCSPFCACACCTISISEPTNQTEILISPIIPAKELGTHYEVSFFNNYFSTIDQPPQV
ncbi:MAG: DUF6660 family protein [Lutibacter sp.]